MAIFKGLKNRIKELKELVELRDAQLESTQRYFERLQKEARSLKKSKEEVERTLEIISIAYAMKQNEFREEIKKNIKFEENNQSDNSQTDNELENERDDYRKVIAPIFFEQMSNRFIDKT